MTNRQEWLARHYQDAVAQSSKALLKAQLATGQHTLDKDRFVQTAINHGWILHIPEVWKCIFMAALGHEVMFTMGLNNQPFPIGFRTSKLNKAQMSDLIEFIYAYGAQNTVTWSEKYE